MGAAAVACPGALPPEEIAARSRSALDRPLSRDVELIVAQPDGDAVLVGAFGRAPAGLGAECILLRRGSGGAPVRIGAGTLWVSLALAHIEALVPCTPDKVLNRYVRPLLRALGRAGALAHYFGRDWVSVAHRPAAAIGFAHDRASGRLHVEAFVAVTTPFAVGERASFRGKPPGTLAELTGKAPAMDRLTAAIAEAYAPRSGELALAALSPAALEATDLRRDPPWAATGEEAIGQLGAGPDASGAFRVGGELMVSRDALAELEARVAAGEDAGAAVDAALAAPDVALEGVRSLRTLADVVARAR
jgi:hypothetical protein